MLLTFRSQLGLQRQRGLSLVEIMVALLLGAVITVGIVQMFTANRATYQINMGQARMQENGRFGMEFLASAIRNAGYTGCSSRGNIFNALNTVGGSVPPEFDMNEPISGFRKASATQGAPSALPSDIPWTDIPVGSDVLVLKAVDGDGLPLAGNMPDSSSVIFSIAPDNPNDPLFATGSILMISDCSKGAVFQVTNSGIVGGGDGRFQIQHNPGGSLVPGNFTQRLAQDDEGFGEDASVYTLSVEFYFVAPGAGTNNANEPAMALWRKRGPAAPVELVEGIETIQVLYGEDTSGNRVPNRYRRIDDVSNPDNIVTLRMTVTASSVDRVTEQGDGRLRRDFTKTIAVRNRT